MSSTHLDCVVSHSFFEFDVRFLACAHQIKRKEDELVRLQLAQKDPTTVIKKLSV